MISRHLDVDVLVFARCRSRRDVEIELPADDTDARDLGSTWPDSGGSHRRKNKQLQAVRYQKLSSPPAASFAPL